MSQITTHVLDTKFGKPAQGVKISLYKVEGDQSEMLASGVTNSDGRITNLLADDYSLESGIYKMKFDIDEYFQSSNTDSFYPHVEIVFKIEDDSQHYHIPLLLSPFGYTTYRGS